MKITFLDIDGVLNSGRFFASPSRKDPLSKEALDPSAVVLLNKLVEATGTKFVISSSWRLYVPWGRLSLWLSHHGFTGEVIGSTPELRDVDRGLEINEWLEAWDRNPHGEDVESIVILDDDADMNPHMSRLVQTTFEDGLTDADIARAIALF